MSDKIDDLLKDALFSSEKPDAYLNKKILQKAKGDNTMRKPLFKTVPIMAALLTAVLATGGLTAYAAWQYLTPNQVAEQFEDKKLAQAFSSRDASVINKSQICGDYKITLLGMISGENLSDYATEVDGQIQTDRTYTVVSIEKRDGTPMPKTSDPEYDNGFLITPFIKGENPAGLNIFHMGGGSSMMVQDGIEYRIIENDNIEVFADRGVYLGVLDSGFYDIEAYNFNKKTGEITRNDNYEGVNALFELPLDKSKADEKAAQEQIEEWKDN